MSAEQIPVQREVPLADDWLEVGWDNAKAASDRLSAKGGTTALAALASTFPRSLAPELRRTRHPVVFDQFTALGRLGLLELGLAIACTPADKEDIERLRNPAEYRGMAAELRAALMFLRAGAKLQRPPRLENHPRCEYVADFPSGQSFSVEVKLPSEGDRELDAMRVSYELLMVLMARLDWLSSAMSHVWATFHFTQTILAFGDRNRVDHERLRSAALDVDKRVRVALDRGELPGRIELGLVGALEVRPGTRLPGVQFASAGPEIAPKKIGRRLRRNLLNKAANQVREANLPGIVILDVQRDSLARNALDVLGGWARSKPALAVLIVIHRSGVVPDPRLYGEVDLVPGPRFNEAVDATARLIETCSAGHLHYNPLCTPAVPCPYEWLARYQNDE